MGYMTGYMTAIRHDELQKVARIPLFMQKVAHICHFSRKKVEHITNKRQTSRVPASDG